MNAIPKPYSSGHSAPSKPSSSTDHLADTAGAAVDSMRDTVSEVLDRGQAAISQAGEAANKMAETASQQFTTIASELAGMTRRNPLGALAGAAIAGVLIGFFARGHGNRA